MFRNIKKHALAVLGWVLLAVSWARVAYSGSVPTRFMTMLPVFISVFTVALMILWVRHTRAIHRRLGPRRGVPQVVPVYAADRLGRRLTVDGTSRSAERWTEIRLLLAPGRKHYFRPG